MKKDDNSINLSIDNILNSANKLFKNKTFQAIMLIFMTWFFYTLGTQACPEVILPKSCGIAQNISGLNSNMDSIINISLLPNFLVE